MNELIPGTLLEMPRIERDAKVLAGQSDDEINRAIDREITGFAADGWTLCHVSLTCCTDGADVLLFAALTFEREAQP